MVLEKVCGEANQRLFVGFSDLFQKIFDALIPDFWPFGTIQYYFDLIFDNLQDQLKPFAYKEGEAMGKNIEDQTKAWITGEISKAKAQIDAYRNDAMKQIQAAQAELTKHTGQIQNLAERLNTIEQRKENPLLGFLGG